MKTRAIGRIAASEIGLGCMGMDHAYGKPAPRSEMVSLLHEALDLGCTLFDTAPVYGTANEELLGEAFADRRDRAVLCTKFGITGQNVENGKPVNLPDSRPESIRAQVEGSLRRLRTDHIDLLYQHRVDPHVEPEVVAGVMADLKKEGKITEWGLSNAPEDYLLRAHAVCPVAAVENQYSMIWREPEKRVFGLCRQLGMAFVAYSPLGNGFLSGRFTKADTYREGDFRGFMNRFKPEAMDHNQPVLDLLQDIASAHGATPAQIVLAWELASGPFILPIPGTTSPKRLKENLGAAGLSLSADEMADITAALDRMDIDNVYF